MCCVRLGRAGNAVLHFTKIDLTTIQRRTTFRMRGHQAKILSLYCGQGSRSMVLVPLIIVLPQVNVASKYLSDALLFPVFITILFVLPASHLCMTTR